MPLIAYICRNLHASRATPSRKVGLDSLIRAFSIIVSVVVLAVTPMLTTANTAAESSYHQLGEQLADSAWAASSNAGDGFLTYGPYTSQYQDGEFKATFELSVDDNSADDLIVAFVDVYDDTTEKEIARREIRRKDFDAARSYQSFDVSFVTLGANNLEFRVYVFGAAYVAHRSTKVLMESSLKRGLHLPADDPSNHHQVGLHGPNSSWISKPSSGPGFLTTTTLSRALTPGNYVAEFAVQIRGALEAGVAAATLDVYNQTTHRVVSVRQATYRGIQTAQPEIVEIPFSYDGVGELELRVYVEGNAYIEDYYSSVSPFIQLNYTGTDPTLLHQFGRANGSAWISDSGTDRGLITFGPNAKNLPPGVATSTFNLTVSEIRAGAEDIAAIDVYDAVTSKVIARRVIKRRDLISESTAQDFDLVFEIAAPTTLQFRVFSMGAAKLQHNSTVIKPDRLSLAALWNHSAHFEFRQRDYFVHEGIHDNDTASIVSIDGTWYAFNRADATHVDPSQASRCSAANRPPLQVVVRASANRGDAWSNPIVVAAPTASESAAGCEVVDGGAFFDGETDTWHYLAQCIGATGTWNLCHYTHAGSSPLAPFDVDSSNPVVIGGALWSQICRGNGKHCLPGMRDEGTPQILYKSTDGYFYVTFHGARYDGAVIGARGIARTNDFQHWLVSGSGLPDDAILSKSDCNRWLAGWAAGGCIGEGASRILRSANQYYQLTEAADLSLLCRAGQKWVFGLLRNSRVGPSGTWENYPANPIIVNQNTSPVGCALQYMNLFRDRGEIYLEFSLYTPDYAFPNYTYQLVDGGGDSNVLSVK